MLSIGHALVGDRKYVSRLPQFCSELRSPLRIETLGVLDLRCIPGRYNPTKRAQRQSKWCDRLFLHAQRLQFDALPAINGNDESETSPRGDEAVDVSVPLPPELQEVLQGMSEVEDIDTTQKSL